MKVLVAMETSGKIRQAFLDAGHDAISCDLLPADDNSPYHYQGDVYDMLEMGGKWDLIIAHPTCTKLCVSGNHVYAEGKERANERMEAIAWTYKLWLKCISICPRVCFENPVGVLTTSTDMPMPQYIQPYMFGDNASKKTALFLHGLEPLMPTQRINGRWVRQGINYVERWDNQTDSGQNRLGPSDDRWKLRSETYPGLAAAIVDQWGKLLQTKAA